MDHPPEDMARAYRALRLEEAKAFRSARQQRLQARAGGPRPAAARRLIRFGRQPVHAPAIS